MHNTIRRAHRVIILFVSNYFVVHLCPRLCMWRAVRAAGSGSGINRSRRRRQQLSGVCCCYAQRLAVREETGDSCSWLMVSCLMVQGFFAFRNLGITISVRLPSPINSELKTTEPTTTTGYQASRPAATSPLQKSHSCHQLLGNG